MLDGAEDAAFVGGFAAAAKLLGRAADLVMLDTTDPQRPRARTLSAALARIVRGRVHPRFIAGQLRHGPRGAAEFAETVDRLFAFAQTTDAVAGELFDLLHDAYAADPTVRDFLLRENPQAAVAIAERFDDARRHGFWHPRRNDIDAALAALRLRRGRVMAATLVANFPTPTPNPSPQVGGERRGACPGLSVPMPTGDGLLVRLLPVGTIPLDAFTALCAAARAHGNGVIEITARGSIQVRGLTATSAPRFADTIATLGIAVDGIPVLTNPLTGIDSAEIFYADALATDLRHELAQRSLSAKLAPKNSVVFDGGGALGLDAVSADVRLEARANDGGDVVRIAIGGDRAGAVALGAIAIAQAVEAAIRLLEVIAQRGRDVRARDILKTEGIATFHTAIADFLIARTLTASCPGSSRASTSSGCAEQEDVDGRDKPGHDAHREAIGLHRLRDQTFACGVGLAFGHADASVLEQLVQAARSTGAVGIRTAPARVLLAIGIRSADVATFVAAAERLGFIINPDDPRRRVIACTGAPGCASAYMPARAIAPGDRRSRRVIAGRR